MRGDFHIHTTYSDGALSVKEILKEARKYYTHIAITDHDCIDGVIEASSIEKSSITIIPGVEVSTQHNGESVHVLAYFSSLDDILKISPMLNAQLEARITRCLKIKDLLLEHFNIDLDVTNLLKRSSITRGSIADEIIKQGYRYTKEYLFSKVIGENNPAYIPSTKVSLIDAIKQLKDAQATLILAHPVLLKKNDYKEIMKLGLDGLEAIYPANTKDKETEFINFANENNYIYTAGSDFHRFNDYKHGNLGSINLPNEQVIALLNKLRKEN